MPIPSASGARLRVRLDLGSWHGCSAPSHVGLPKHPDSSLRPLGKCWRDVVQRGVCTVLKLSHGSWRVCDSRHCHPQGGGPCPAVLRGWLTEWHWDGCTARKWSRQASEHWELRPPQSTAGCGPSGAPSGVHLGSSALPPRLLHGGSGSVAFPTCCLAQGVEVSRD